MKWRRRHIEGYLLCKAAIARAAKVEVEKVEEFFMLPEYAIALPDDTRSSDVALSIREAHAKEMMTEGNSIRKNFRVTRDKIASALTADEIADDLNTFFAAIGELSK